MFWPANGPPNCKATARRCGPCAWASAASWAWRFIIGGLLLFSGSLYLLAYTQMKWLAHVTPFGGVSFMLGWICISFAKWKD
jgi:uncharacterized membrane protein YgdD (TMEM256/DUF423 family)